MKIIKFSLVLISLFITTVSFAQLGEGKGSRGGSTMHTLNPQTFERTRGTSGTGSNIDVLYHKIFWRLNPDTAIGKYIKGSVQFNFKTTQASVSTITFDLRSVLDLDSIRFRNNKFLLNSGYTRSGNIVTLNLGASLPINFIDSFTVHYKGVPPAATAVEQGFQITTGTTAGNVLSTLSESYEDRDWWPCKADMQDKIDSMDITVSVPWGSPAAVDTFWVATNGKMVDSSIVGNSRIFKFKTKYPIASYLVSVTVARFERTYWSVNTGTTTTPVVYNLLKGGTSNAAARNAITNQVNPTLQKWSTLFGEYPFRLEKHGFSAGMDGTAAMEHQTMSSMTAGTVANVSVLIHEMTHQWFGDNVTFAHWNDLWLAEGFAEYSYPLSLELVPSVASAALPSTALSVRSTLKSGAIALNAQSAWIPNASSLNSVTIWNTNYGSTVYKRGAMIVSMLRTMCGDSIFFKTLTKYQTELAGKSVTADTLKNYFNRELGVNITPFFDDYVGGSDTTSIVKGGIGSPTNSIQWNAPTTFGQGGKRLVVTVASQTRTTGSNVAYFRGPIQLHIKGAAAANDTTITIFDWGNGNLSYAGKGISTPVAGNKLTFDLSFVPITMLYDDSSRTMNNGTIAKNTALESNLWLGTTNTDWNTASNWQANVVPASGADVTIATAVNNQPILPNNVIVGPLTILGTNSVNLNGKAFTLNLDIRALGTGTFTGSPTSVINVETNAGEIRMDQTTASTRSLSTINMKPKSRATLGNGAIEIYNGLNLPAGSFLNIKTNGLLIR